MEGSDTTIETPTFIWSPVEEECELEEASSEEEDVSEPEDDVEHACYEEEDESSSEEEEEEEEEEIEESAPFESFQSKDGNVLWSPDPFLTKRKVMDTKRLRCRQGPTRYAISRVDTIKSTFDLFLPDMIQNVVLQMTNIEGRRVFGDQWVEIDQTYLQAYLGLLILAGVYRSSKEATSSLWGAHSGRPIFRATLSLKAFHMISKVLRFDNRETRPARLRNDKMAAIRNVWDKWVARLPLMYNPGVDLSVDERLVPFKGRCSFRQYMRSKPGKYGIKIWAACDPRSSYAYNMQVYTGRPKDGKPEKNQGRRVVLDMMKGLKGHTVTCDNFFTSYALGEELLKRKLTMVGTVRRTKTELPPALMVIKNRRRYSSRFAFTESHTLVSYVPRRGRNVLLMSTRHKDAAVSDRKDKKPQIILDYNRNKGGVDNLDKVTAAYTCKRKTARWPLVIFFNIIDVSTYNAFVLWTEINPSWHRKKSSRRRLFLEELGRELVTPLIQRRQFLPRMPAAASLVVDIQKEGSAKSAGATPPPSPAAKRKMCKFCPPRNSRTKNRCAKCEASICKAHTVIYCHSCK